MQVGFGWKGQSVEVEVSWKLKPVGQICAYGVRLLVEPDDDDDAAGTIGRTSIKTHRILPAGTASQRTTVSAKAERVYRFRVAAFLSAKREWVVSASVTHNVLNCADQPPTFDDELGLNITEVGPGRVNVSWAGVHRSIKSCVDYHLLEFRSDDEHRIKVMPLSRRWIVVEVTPGRDYSYRAGSALYPHSKDPFDRMEMYFQARETHFETALVHGCSDEEKRPRFQGDGLPKVIKLPGK